MYLGAYLFTNLGAFAVISIAPILWKATIFWLIRGFPKILRCWPRRYDLFTSLAGLPPLADLSQNFMCFASTIRAGFAALPLPRRRTARCGFLLFQSDSVMYLMEPEKETTLKYPAPALLALWVLLVELSCSDFSPSRRGHDQGNAAFLRIKSLFG